MNFSAQDKVFMQKALALAQKGLSKVSPNPAVGAVVVKNGKVIGEGYYSRYGADHAEAVALKKAGTKARGSTLYCTLEPCNHWGIKPPCTDAIIKSGIKRVVFAAEDPNPKVKAKNTKQILKKHKIKVESGLLAQEAESLNLGFHFFMQNKKPLVALKIASSLDGKIATASGESKWITGPKSRQKVQELRRKFDAILIGSNTAKRDNPGLLVTPVYAQSLRIVLDSTLKLSLSLKIFNTAQGDTMVFTTKKASKNKIEKMRSRGVGVKILPCKNRQGKIKINLKSVIKAIEELNLLSVLIEGGSTLNRAFLEENLIDRIYWFIAPKLIPGQDSLNAIGGPAIKKLTQHKKFKIDDIERFGEDILITVNPLKY